MPTIAAMVYKYSIGQPLMYPRNDLSYSENFLHMMFNTPCEIKPISPVLAKAMDRIFILHADHEQNASTSTVRLAGSTGANPFASRRHPAQAASRRYSMLDENVSNVIRRSLMGFGHRV